MSKRMVDLEVVDGKIASIDGHEVGGGTAVQANPQEEATQQLEKIKIDNIAYNIAGGGGSGGSYNVISSVAYGSTGSGVTIDTQWGSIALQPNTSYAVGDQVVVEFTRRFNAIASEPNQILIPICAHLESFTHNKITYGDVELVLTNNDIALKCSRNDNNAYTVSAKNRLRYTVIKAGNTSSDVSLVSGGWLCDLDYLIYTLGVTKVTA